MKRCQCASVGDGNGAETGRRCLGCPASIEASSVLRGARLSRTGGLSKSGSGEGLRCQDHGCLGMPHRQRSLLRGHPEASSQMIGIAHKERSGCCGGSTTSGRGIPVWLPPRSRFLGASQTKAYLCAETTERAPPNTRKFELEHRQNPAIGATLVRRTRRNDPAWNAVECDPVIRSGGKGASPNGR
jgi:hypothetical protein